MCSGALAADAFGQRGLDGLCCGRPLYDHGFLGMAKDLLRNIMTALRPDIEAGTPIVGLEPSCVAVFRDELVNFFADDPVALRLSGQVYTLAEFLVRYAPDYRPGYLPGKALLHEGDRILVNRQGLKPDAEVRFEEVLLLGDDKGAKVGKPTIAGAAVVGKVLGEKKGEKLVVFKFRRRKDSKSKKGHRQHYTAVRVESIKG